MKFPKVLSISKAKSPRYGVLFYATVQSRTDHRKHYTVTIGKTSSVCGCPTGVFRRTARTRCIHVRAVCAKLARGL